MATNSQQSPSPGPEASRSGITTNTATGERYIPSSVRADGSKRREIRVRPGYRPPEDVEVYKNRTAHAWKNRGKGGVPGAEGLSSGDDKSGAAAAAAATSNKNAKRREAKRKAKEAMGSSEQEKSGQIAQQQDRDLLEATQTADQPQPIDPEAEREKKARNLKKKLRQARDLREKKDQGEALLPEQLEKVIKINELIRQLDVLGFDANGERKVEEGGKGDS